MFEDKYPELFQFFAGYFPEADLDGLTDDQVVQGYIKESPSELINEVQKELGLLLSDESSWGDAAMEANRHFEKNEELRQWLERVQLRLSDQ